MNTARPLDLRLLPAALAAWAAALISVLIPWEQARQLGWACLVAGVLLTVAAWLLNRLVTDPVPLHVLLCCVVAGAVALQASTEGREHSESGWEQAIEDQAPVTVIIRVSGQPEILEESGFGGENRVLAHAKVLSARWPGQQAHTAVDAPVVIIHEFTGPDPPLVAGHRYEGMVRLSPTDPGERETAVAYPFGEQLERLAPDRRTEFTEVFNELRAATTRASTHAVGDAPALLPGLILGDRSAQDEDLTEAMRAAGLSHLTAVSGANCALVMGTLMGLVRMLRLPRWSSVPVSLLGLVFFILLVHPEPSVIRAGVMGSIAAISLFAGRGRSAFSLLCLCVLMLLVFDPNYGREPAFQLSAAATAGIVVIGTRIREQLERYLPTIVAAPLALAFSAQLFVTPVLLPLSAAMNTYAVPANVLAAPFVPLITIPGTFAAVISTTMPWLAVPILWCCGLAAASIGWIGRAAASLPQALAPWPEGPVGWGLVVLYLSAAVVLVVGLVDRFRRWYVGLLAVTSGAMLALVLPAAALGPSGLPGEWRVALCDVGQGDMLVVRTGVEAGIVVDAGEDPVLADDCLRQLRVSAVDAFLVTHEHEDHYGGAEGIFAHREVGQILYSASEDWNLSREVAAAAVLPDDVPVLRAQAGDSLRYTGDVTVTVTVWAAEDHHKEANDNSMVSLFQISDSRLSAASVGSPETPLRLLVTGDMEQEAAAAMIRKTGLPAGVHLLKVAHHGAANGGTQVIEELDPAVALIGVGEDNSYGHPAETIIAALEEVGAAVYRTDVHGTVVISVEADGLQASPLR